MICLVEFICLVVNQLFKDLYFTHLTAINWVLHKAKFPYIYIYIYKQGLRTQSTPLMDGELV